MKLYETTAQALKDASLLLRIGGPASAQLGYVDEFINQSPHVVGGEVVTTHLYPTDPVSPFLDFSKSIASTAQKAQQYTQTFILTEFNSGLYGNDVGNHDRAFAAAFLISFASDVLQQVVNVPRLDDFMASYWTFSDVFEEQGFPTVDFKNGYGMMTYKGIPKPAYRAMELLSFDQEAVEVLDVTVVGAAAIPGTLKALALRSGEPGAPVRKVRVFVSNLDVPTAALQDASVKITFESTPTTAVIYKIDSKHTNPRETGEQMGQPDLQGATLQQVMDSSVVESVNAEVAGNAVILNVAAWGCAVLEVSWVAPAGEVSFV